MLPIFVLSSQVSEVLGLMRVGLFLKLLGASHGRGNSVGVGHVLQKDDFLKPHVSADKVKHVDDLLKNALILFELDAQRESGGLE